MYFNSGRIIQILVNHRDKKHKIRILTWDTEMSSSILTCKNRDENCSQESVRHWDLRPASGCWVSKQASSGFYLKHLMHRTTTQNISSAVQVWLHGQQGSVVNPSKFQAWLMHTNNNTRAPWSWHVKCKCLTAWSDLGVTPGKNFWRSSGARDNRSSGAFDSLPSDSREMALGFSGDPFPRVYPAMWA